MLSTTILGLFYSCTTTKEEKNIVDKDVIKKEEMHKARALFITPDSLRSPEDKELFQQLETAFFEVCMQRKDTFEMSINKKEWEERGLPGIYYDIFKKDVSDLNYFINTQSPSTKQAVLDVIQKSMEEWLVRKKSQHIE